MSEAKADSGKKAKGKKGLILIVAVALILGGGGGGFFWWKNKQAAEAAATRAKDGHKQAAAHDDEEHAEDAGTEEEHEAAEEAEVSGALPFEPFIVNLADTDASRYLKANIGVVVSEAENFKELEEDKVVMLRLRSAILEHLSQQTSETLVTPEGKQTLKKELAKRCGKVLGHHAKVADVLFNEFVVQF